MKRMASLSQSLLWPIYRINAVNKFSAKVLVFSSLVFSMYFAVFRPCLLLLGFWHWWRATTPSHLLLLSLLFLSSGS